MKFTRSIVLAVPAILAGCTLGPSYQRPSAIKAREMPAAFTGVGTNQSAAYESSTNASSWKTASPAAHLARGSWWDVFQDDALKRLEALAQADNQDLAASLARLEQARALVKVARSSLFPQLNLDGVFTRQRTSANAPQEGKAAGRSYEYNTLTIPADLSWELDLWGRVRRETESAKAHFVATADDFESLKLSIEAEIAADYFALRALEGERVLLVDTIQTYKRSLELTQNRRKGGIVTDLDVSEAETQLRSAEAQLPAVDRQHATILHALATLCGQPATSFDVSGAKDIHEGLPEVPVGLPSDLLERRPDIAAAERRMAAANADIGVATTAFYPRVVFHGLAGFQSVNAGALFDWPSRVWAIGPSLELPLFTGGRNRAQLAIARQAYDETVANYRQTVLTAFQEVEDQLAASSLVGTQLEAGNAALASARRTLQIATNRYQAGLVTYLEVAAAQSAALTQERSVVQLQGERLVTMVNLIKALGGEWQADS